MTVFMWYLDTSTDANSNTQLWNEMKFLANIQILLFNNFTELKAYLFHFSLLIY